jgi:hypothetical protein
VSGAQVANMLETIVALSQRIASHLTTPNSGVVPAGTPASNGLQQQVVLGDTAASQGALKAQEVERIVKRVEAHFQARQDKAKELLDQQTELLRQVQQSKDLEIANLKLRIRDLEQQLTSSRYPEFCLPVEDHNGNKGPGGGGSSPNGEAAASFGNHLSPMNAVARQRLQQQRAALSELEQQWGFISPSNPDAMASAHPSAPVGSARTNDTNHLRLMLVGEKRQRLLVEEQTQDLAEQHAKVIMTLEQRLRKQEKQIHDLTQALTATSNGDGADVVRGGGTPRGLTRGSLSGRTHQRRSLNDEKNNSSGPQTESPSQSPPSTSSALPEPRVLRVFEMPPPAPLAPVTSKIDAGSAGGSHHLQSTLEDSSSKQARLAADDVASFLESISKELESISEGESQRQAKLLSI